MKTAVQLKKPYGQGTFSRVKNARYLGWEDAFDIEFEDGLCFLEPHATIRKANHISAGAVPVRVEVDKELGSHFKVTYDTGEIAEVSWSFIREWPPKRGKTRHGIPALLAGILVLSLTYLPASSNPRPAAAPQDNSGTTSTFETGTTEGWQPRGNVTLTPTSTDQHGGGYSLLTTGRTATWQGPRINVAGKMYTGSRYRVSVWVKLAPGAPTTNLIISLERTLAGATTYTNVVSTRVTASEWAPLTTVYDYAFNHDSLWLYVESTGGTPSFYIDDFQLTYLPPPKIQPDIPSVFETLADDFPVGAAIQQTEITGVHGDLLKKHFNSVTPGNAMKWDATEPGEGVFNFAPADALVNFAKANNMLIRGHTLVWHQQVPAWVFQVNGQPMTPTPEHKALLLQRLENHIRAVVSHYKDDVSAWDVVNEVIDPGQPDGVRRSQWFRIAGPDYIERAFRVAHEVAPDAKLYINDYNSTESPKREFLLNLARDLKDRGVPIDGVGHQMHSNIDWPSAASIIETVNLFSAQGFDNQITELDISVYNNSTQIYTSVPEAVLIRQGYRYRDFFQAFRQLKGKISSVTIWGLADDRTWLKTFPITRLDLPLLFDESLQAKPAYWGVVDPSRLP